MISKFQIVKAIIREYKSKSKFKNKIKNIDWSNIKQIYDLDNEGFYYYNDKNIKTNMYWHETSENLIDVMFNLI